MWFYPNFLSPIQRDNHRISKYLSYHHVIGSHNQHQRAEYANRHRWLDSKVRSCGTESDVAVVFSTLNLFGEHNRIIYINSKQMLLHSAIFCEHVIFHCFCVPLVLQADGNSTEFLCFDFSGMSFDCFKKASAQVGNRWSVKNYGRFWL